MLKNLVESQASQPPRVEVKGLSYLIYINFSSQLVTHYAYNDAEPH